MAGEDCQHKARVAAECLHLSEVVKPDDEKAREGERVSSVVVGEEDRDSVLHFLDV